MTFRATDRLSPFELQCLLAVVYVHRDAGTCAAKLFDQLIQRWRYPTFSITNTACSAAIGSAKVHSGRREDTRTNGR
jgi:hypothetical protein